MMHGRTVPLACVVAAVFLGEKALAVPPPPPSLQASARAHDLIAAITRGDGVAYGAQLDPDVHVFDNGKQVASNKAGWLRQFVGQMQNEDVSVLMQAISSDQILTVEHVSTIGKTMRRCGGPLNGCTVDCCDWARTGAYDLSPEGKIVGIRYQTSASYWETPEHPQ
jgi:hypothetical protein